MAKYIAFLRGINVGRQKLIKMELLRELFSAMGFQQVRTYIQTGNVVFEAGRTTEAALQKKIERYLQQELGYEVDIFLRTLPEMEALVKANPFPEPEEGKGRIYVAFLHKAPAKAAQQAVLALNNAVDTFHVTGREVIVLSVKGFMESVLSDKMLEKVLGVRVTIRNWNTVKKVQAI